MFQYRLTLSHLQVQLLLTLQHGDLLLNAETPAGTATIRSLEQRKLITIVTTGRKACDKQAWLKLTPKGLACLRMIQDDILLLNSHNAAPVARSPKRKKAA